MRLFPRSLKTVVYTAIASVWCSAAFAQQANPQYLHNETPAGWTALQPGEMPDTVNILIRSGHTIALDTDVSIKSMKIEGGGTLQSVSAASSANIYTLKPGAITDDGKAIIHNDGMLGSPVADSTGIALLVPASSSEFTLQGGGKTSIASIRPQKTNSSLTITINQDVDLHGSGIVLSAIPALDSSLTEDNITLNIAAGKTVTLTNAAGEFHGLSPKQEGGKYTYNISGTLDASATTAVQNIAPFKNSPASAVEVNIGGVLKFGDALNIAPPEGQPGSLKLTIANNGVADATATNSLTAGSNYFVTHGTGVLKRTVGNTNMLFPVAAEGAVAANPVMLNNSGMADVFAVSVKSQFDVSVPNSTKIVNRQWTIEPQTATGNNVTVSPMWLTADQAAGFNVSAPVSIIRYNNSTDWEAKTAMLAGNGVEADPYRATADGFTSFGIFAVQNNDITQPPATMSVYPNPAATTINLSFPQVTNTGSLYVTTYDGKKMLSQGIEKGAVAWSANVSGWPSGIYFIMMENDGKKSSFKFIKQ